MHRLRCNEIQRPYGLEEKDGRGTHFPLADLFRETGNK